MALVLSQWHELQGSPQESFAEESGPAAERIFLGPWTQRWDFAEYLSGRVVANGAERPLRYPYLPHLYVRDISISPFSANLVADPYTIANLEIQLQGYAAAGTAAALVRVQYGPGRYGLGLPLQDVTPPVGTELLHTARAGGQFLVMEGRKLEWEDKDSSTPGGDPMPPVPEDQQANLLVPTVEHEIIWRRIPADKFRLVWRKIKQKLGFVNDAEFLLSSAETVLLEDATFEEVFTVDPDNPYCYTIAMNFRERKIIGDEIEVEGLPTGIFAEYGWNHIYRDYPAGWVKVKKTDGKYRYETTDFLAIFTFTEETQEEEEA